jgi:transitional endoplasmic reticulum ATPase
LENLRKGSGRHSEGQNRLAPSIIFFDEIDAIAPQRGGGLGDSNVTERVISQLFTELDGLEELRNVVVIAATNRPDIIDPALLRAGRFDRIIGIKTPSEDARKGIFEIHLKDKPLATDVNLDILAEKTDNYVGADIEAVCREASTRARMLAIREYVKKSDDKAGKPDFKIGMKHFEEALSKVKAIGKSRLADYDKWSREFEDAFR